MVTQVLGLLPSLVTSSSVLLSTDAPFTTVGQSVSRSPRGLRVHALVPSHRLEQPSFTSPFLSQLYSSLLESTATSHVQQGLPRVQDHHLLLPWVFYVSSLTAPCVWVPALTWCLLSTRAGEQGQAEAPHSKDKCGMVPSIP